MQRLRAEKDEIRGTGQFQGGEHWFRGDDQRRQAGTGRDGPDELSARHARGGQYPGSTAADERVADGQRGVLAGRDDARMETPRNAARLTAITSRYDGSIAKSNDSGAQTPMTAVGFQALKSELAELRGRRPALVEEVAAARSQGDLSENFAYHDARQHLGMLDGRIQTIEATLARAQVVEQGDAQGVARIGSTVVVRDEFGESTYQIVGPTEGNMARG